MIIRTLTVAATAVAALFASPGAVHADGAEHDDARRDALVFVDSHEGSPAPRHKRADITHLAAFHGDGYVGATISTRDLVRRRSNVTIMRVHTSQGRTFLSFLTVDRGSRPRLELLRAGSGRPVRCANDTFHFKPAADSLTVSIPRACVGGHLRWVRIGVVHTWAPHPGGRVYADDALLDGRFSNRGPALGPRIRHN